MTSLPEGFRLEGRYEPRASGTHLALKMARTAHRQCRALSNTEDFTRAQQAGNNAGNYYLEVIELAQKEHKECVEDIKRKSPTAAPRDPKIQDLERRQKVATELLEQAKSEYEKLTQMLREIQINIDRQTLIH